jgi:hypothetical protein
VKLFGEFAWLNFPDEIRIVSLSGTIRVRLRIVAELTFEGPDGGSVEAFAPQRH